jgi:hypothetical protein
MGGTGAARSKGSGTVVGPEAVGRCTEIAARKQPFALATALLSDTDGGMRRRRYSED